MLKLSAPRKRLFGFILLGWALLLISDRIGELRQYQGAFVAMYALAIASIILYSISVPEGRRKQSWCNCIQPPFKYFLEAI